MPKSKLLMDIGNRLLEHREKLGLTQKEVAALLKMSETNYGEIERGNKKLTVERLVQLSEVLDVDLTWLLTGERITPHFSAELMDKCDPKKKDALKGMLEELRALYKKRF